MKNLLFGLIATVVFTSSTFAQNDNFIDADMYGTYHNEVLEVYSNKYKDSQETNFIKIYETLKTEFDVLHPKVLTDEEYLFYKNRLITILGADGNLNSRNFRDQTIKGIKKFYTQKTQLVLIDLIENPKAPTLVNKILQNLFSDSDLPDLEINEIKKLISVFSASIKYWSVPFSDDNKKACNPKHQLYIADIAGCMFGGLGSIGLSWLVDEMQSQNGGGCI